MKKPIFLIPTAGKSKEQLKKEVKHAFENYKEPKPAKKMNKSEKNEQIKANVSSNHTKILSKEQIKKFNQES